MAKKKSKPQKTPFNPITYLKSGSARKLPVFECLLPKDWEVIKKFPVILARQHVNGNITFISVLVDLLCTGAKDVLFFVNEPESFYREILGRYKEELSLEFLPASYELIHNVIFESVAFAEEYGIAPHEDFRWAELVLAEDEEDFPRIEIPLGEDGKAILYLNLDDERAPYFERQILKYGNPESYQIIRNDFNPFLDDLDWDAEEEEDEYLDSCYGWSDSEWEDFYEAAEFDNLHPDIVYFTIGNLSEFRYEEMVEEPLFAPFMEIEWTGDPTSKNSFSKQEIELMEEVLEIMEDTEMEFEEPVPELLELIEVGIEKWPKNEFLFQYKWEYLQRAGELDKALKYALEIKEKFPDYLIGQTLQANTLLKMGEVDGIPGAMNNLTKIQDFDPKREKFHLSELHAFYSPWIYFYAKTGQIRAAHFLVTFLEDNFVTVDYPIHDLVDAAYFEEATKVVSSFYQKVKSGKVSKEEFMEMIKDE